MENRYKINYDIKQRIVSNVRFKQGDIDSSVLDVMLFDGGLPVVITGEVIEFRFFKADKTIVFQDISTGVTIVDGAKGNVQCVLMSNTLASPGDTKVEIHRSLAGKQLTTPSFVFKVDSSIGEGGVASTNYISSIDSKVVGWQAEVNVIKAAYEAAGTANLSLEVSNARTSAVKAKVFTTLDARLEESEQDFSAHTLDNVTQLGLKAPQTALDITNTNVTNMLTQLTPKKHIFGGQIEKLKFSLSNPLEQFTGICFVGDSITWGRSLPENSSNFETGRDGTLSDIRDLFISPSFVNNFKRYIGEKYSHSAVPAQSNWSASPSGEAITTYTKEYKLYPYGGDFNYTSTGALAFFGSLSSPPSILGYQLAIVIESAVTGEATISFPFTGDSFTFSFASVVGSMDYELFVDGVSKGIFKTEAGFDGIVSGYDQRRTHTFGYVRNKTIQIKTRKSAYVGNQTLKAEGIIINKKIRITNQGIIGQTSKGYLANCMSGIDGVSVGAYDNYVFIQFGANDRIIDASYAKGSNEFKKNLKELITPIVALSDVILMASLPTTNENPLSYSFDMQSARNVVYRLAKENLLDFIDNYTLFENANVNTYLADGLHPNTAGHMVISRNIINALES